MPKPKDPNANPIRSQLSGGYIPGIVYLLECDGFYKIGFTNTLKARLSWIRWDISQIRDLPIMDAANLRVVHTVPTNNMRLAEKAAHGMFNAKKIHGDRTCEWFALDADEVAWFCGLTEINVLDLPLQEKWAPGGHRKTLAVSERATTMQLDRNELDRYITGNYGEDQYRDEDDRPDEGIDMPVMESLEPETITPQGAIWRTMLEYQRELADWRKRDDPHGVAADLEQRIAALTLARKDLDTYYKLKSALKDVLA